MPQLPANHPARRQVLRLLRNPYQHTRAARPAAAAITVGPANPRGPHSPPKAHNPMGGGPQNLDPLRCRCHRGHSHYSHPSANTIERRRRRRRGDTRIRPDAYTGADSCANPDA